MFRNYKHLPYVQELSVPLYSGTRMFFGMSLHLTVKLDTVYCGIKGVYLYRNAASSDYTALNLRIREEQIRKMVTRSDKGPNLKLEILFFVVCCLVKLFY